MSAGLGNFLVNLACDPDLLAQFREHPEIVSASASLTLDEQEALLTRDSRRLASALGMSLAKTALGITTQKQPKKIRKPAKKGPRKPGGSKKR